MISEVILLGGVPGVGKSTVCHELDSHGYQTLDFGEIMMKLAEHNGLKNPRWKMHDLPQKEIRQLETMAVKAIMDACGQIILESQIVVATERGFYDGFPKRIVSALPITKILLLETTPEEIMMRRKMDPDRRASLFRYKVDIVEHQNKNRQRSNRLSTRYNAQLSVIINKQEELINTVANVLKNL